MHSLPPPLRAPDSEDDQWMDALSAEVRAYDAAPPAGSGGVAANSEAAKEAARKEAAERDAARRLNEQRKGEARQRYEAAAGR